MNFTELANLEKEIYQNQSKNLIGIVTPSEKIIVCLGEYQKPSLSNWGKSLDYFVLTDFRILANNNYMNFSNIMLDNITSVDIRNFFTGSELIIRVSESARMSLGKSGNVLPRDFTDSNYIKWLAGEINKYVSEANIRLRSQPVITNQGDGLVDQLQRLASLYNSGAITQSEYQKAKDKLLSS